MSGSDPIQATLRPDTDPEAFWASRYELAATLAELGARNDAKLSIEDAARQSDGAFDGGRFGYEAKFKALLEKLYRK